MTLDKPLGTVIEGSLNDGLLIKLYPYVSIEEMRVGEFLVIQGVKSRFFCILSDVKLDCSSPRILADPPRPENDLMAEILAGSGIFNLLELEPMLMFTPTLHPEAKEELSVDDEEELRQIINENKLKINPELALMPVKTVPSHFSQVYRALETDFQTVFGNENDPSKKNFAIGRPLDMEVPVCIDLNRFVERSNGIFGKSGTGKSFLTRLLISGVIAKNAAVNLMFDMHSEYGWEAVSEGRNQTMVKGLKQLFPGQVEIYTLDPESTLRRGVNNACELYLTYDQIEIEDLKLVSRQLGLKEASLDSATILEKEFGKHWITELTNMSNEQIAEFCEAKQGHKGSISALQRKLMRLESLKYIKSAVSLNYIDRIIESLEAGVNVVIEFGTQSNLLSYMLATNMITRRIHAKYVKKAEHFLHTQDPKDKPRQLVITIEEAHRFLDSSIVNQTIFGTIAREMRKYFVTLLVVDQRPSGIDNEVMSQVGTRITCLLNDDKDIDAIFTGVTGSGGLRNVLAKLDSKQQALILGHAVPMPVVIRTRSYDSQFYSEIAPTPFVVKNGKSSKSISTDDLVF